MHSHGQGLETTLAQVAHEILGIDIAKIKVVHGDTAMTPYSTGTWGSRCMVMAGGAVSMACKEIAKRAAKIGAQLLQTDVSQRRRCVRGESRATSSRSRSPRSPAPGICGRRICRATSIRAASRRRSATGRRATAAPSAMPRTPRCVAVDPEIGDVEILDYVIVEDGGMLVNPMIVDGQIYGGLAQGIGTALYEEMPFDSAGQPLASTFADYLLPGPTEVPAPRLDHMETPSPHTEFGVKGIGEGGAIAPPAAIANAVNDALRPLGVELAGFADHAAAGVVCDCPRGTECDVKPVTFDYARPVDFPAALALAAQADADVKIIAGGQSLGPMLNLRLVQPDLLVDITGIAELKHVEQKGDALFIGTCITHADIEDGRVPDVTGGAMRAVAAGIAYRAVRNRGTIGGSLVHADPRRTGYRRWRRSGRRPSSAGLIGSAAFLSRRS